MVLLGPALVAGVGLVLVVLAVGGLLGVAFALEVVSALELGV